jgi:hypothetical protein
VLPSLIESSNGLKMTTTKHVHKLKKVRFKTGNVIFFCALPDCTYKINPALALGKLSICWRCGKSFSLSEYALRLMKPHCIDCHKGKGSVNVEIIGQIEVDENVIIDKSSIKIDPSVLALAEQLDKLSNSANTDEEEGDI